MPLPTGGPWPPRNIDAVKDRLAVWGAWYSGDPDDLDRVYGAATAYTAPGDPYAFETTSVGRLRSRVARWFWGTPTSMGERRSKQHIPVASDVAALSADLLFSDPPNLSVPDATATAARLEEYVEGGLWSQLREAAEVCAAMGGVYLRVVWDQAVNPTPWITAMHPDAAVPEWTYDRLTAVTFWNELARDGKTVLRWLERHEPGVILHGLFEGTDTKLGRRIPLTEHPATAPLAEVLTSGDTIVTGTPLLTAVYVPNMRPNRLWRDIPTARHYGRADVSGVEALMDALDETWSSWMRDIRLGKARLLVPQTALESLGKGQGATFDTDREVFVGIDTGPSPDGALITANQFAIRVAEHQATAQALVEQIVRSAGYSMQTFSEAGDVAVTATEVSARERRSLITRGKKIGYVRPELARILEALLAVDVANFRPAGVTPVRPRIEFPDGVSEDPKDLAQTLVYLQTAQAASVETKVRMLHPDWDKTQVEAEVAAITGATAGTVAGLP